LGMDGSATGWGNKWDFIIVHESGHEWFGNNITAADIADMWIHESFTNYSESLYIDYHYGINAAKKYIHNNRRSIQKQEPLIGTYHVNSEGSGDMYNKGGVLHNMIRTIINDDEKWRQILRGLNKQFYHGTVNYQDIVDYISQQSGKDLSKVFAQYVLHPDIPTLEFYFDHDGKTFCRWIAAVPDFDMPVRIRAGNGIYEWIRPTTKLTPVAINGLTKANLEVDTFNFYIGVLINE